eukprot:TRINITY_DN330_c0_g1_i3.p2 TRINITY_DN330_c0_g1~~TRINITY_DN330_c0_g1_i3.p2  ORF type:complete len:103 (+),score=13.70 TRINITY_DN330_c0_g1_i3:21-329(+)
MTHRTYFQLLFRYVNGKRHGRGKMVYKNKVAEFDGDWSEGQRHGVGVLRRQEFVYRGEWKYGKMHGTGTKTWKNGDSYHGDWREGEKDGEGTSTFGEHKGDK